ncbi:MAG: sulfite exporter TauE/SafE family protein [Dehalococcoidales bacterium]|nr:sulfite exporter TauE/SafE family protein [Dehalococcoidales bacterium]
MEAESITFAIAFMAGLLSFSSPCVLPLVPAYLSFLAGSAVTGVGAVPPTRRRVMLQALAFVAGFSLVFIALGALAGLVGYSLQPQLPLLRKVGGIILIILGLHVAGVIKISALYREWRPGLAAKPTFGGATSFVVGMVFAFGWTPCVGPVLGGILLLAGTSTTAGHGALLLASYSLGMGIPFLIAGLLAGSLVGLLKSLNRYLRLVETISGVLLVALGILIFTGELETLTTLVVPPF